MILTGKCKEDFEKWLDNNKKFSIVHDVGGQFNVVCLGDLFEQLNLSMQYGVLVDFFHEVGYTLEIQSVGEPTMQGFRFFGFRVFINNFKESRSCLGTRKEARSIAISKANEMYNKKLYS